MRTFYIVTGRIPYDDEDSIKVIEADDINAADAAFRAIMLEENGGESTETEEDGPVVYVNNMIKVVSETEPIHEWSNY